MRQAKTALQSHFKHIHIEVTNVCNFQCEFCADADMKRRRGHMKLDLLRKILDEVADFSGHPTIFFHLMGEPLLHPHIFDAIAMAVERGLNLELITNGSTFHLLPEHIHQLVESRIPKVTVSLQTPDAQTFNLRGAKGLKAEQYFRGIVRFTRENMLSESNTIVQIKFMDSTPTFYSMPYKTMHIIEGQKQLHHHLTDWAERILDGTVPDSRIQEIIGQKFTRVLAGVPRFFIIHPKVVLHNFPLENWGNLNQEKIYHAKVGYCDGTTGQLGIFHNGTVVPCCTDFDGFIPLGNVNDQSLEQILQDQPARDLTQTFDRLQVQHSLCQKCLGANTRGKSIVRQLGSIIYYKMVKPWIRTKIP
ncbi:MAG: radical SAM protein [Chloroflexi bacterium]|nr:radical SAM protein [Chloroflexota bacterium]